MFEVTFSSRDNHELAVQYYRKAAAVKPSEPEPYVWACDCYDPDLNIPPATGLIEFLKTGLPHLADPTPLFKRLGELYTYIGDQEQGRFYRLKSENPQGNPPPHPEEGEQPSA